MIMKRLKVFLLLLNMYLGLFAQVTDLTVDCQTPGWLSSKIDYPDQETVRSLRVTGYLNKTDLKFLGSLIANRSLNVALDLADVNIVAEDSYEEDNTLSENCFQLSGDATLRKLILPTNITGASGILEGGLWVDSLGGLFVDSLYVNWKFGTVSDKILGDGLFRHLFLGENVDSIPNWAFYPLDNKDRLCSIVFPPNMRYIGDEACCGSRTYICKLNSVNFEDLEHLMYFGKYAFKFSHYTPDTLTVPITWKEFDTSTLTYKDGQHIFFSDKMERITCNTSAVIYNVKPFDEKKVFLHFKTPQPPKLPGLSSKITVYVPKGAKEAYKLVTSANIIEEIPIEAISVSPSSLSLEVGELAKIAAEANPFNANDKSIVWESGDESVATVSDIGEVKAIRSGQTFIYAVSGANPNIKDSCLITVIKHVEGIIIEPENARLEKVGQTMQLKALVTPDDATNKNVTWKSLNSNVCIVTESGYIIAVGYGTAIITATTEDGKIPATCTIIVKKREVPASVISWNETQFVYSGQSPTPTWRNTMSEYQATADIPALNKNVGTWNIVIPFTFKDDLDEIVIEVPYTYTIIPASVDVSVDDASRLYGDENPAFNIRYNGFVNDEADEVLTSKASARTSADRYSDVGVYNIEVSGAEAQNYVFDYKKGELTIIPASVTVSVDDASRLYGDENPAFNIRYIGLVNDETDEVLTSKASARTSAERYSDVGVYNIEVSGAEAQNYVFDYRNGKLTIEKAYQSLIWNQDFNDIQQFDQVELNAIATSGLEVTYSIEGDSIGSIVRIGSSQYLDCTGFGKANLIAVQEGNRNYWQTTKLSKTIEIIPTNVCDLSVKQSFDVQGIYDVNGRKLSKPQRGINFLIMKDGAKRKLVVR